MGLFPSSLDVSGDKNANVKAGEKKVMLISIFHCKSQNQAKYQKRGYIKMVDSSKFSDVRLQRRNAIRSFCQHHFHHHSWRPAHQLLSLSLSNQNQNCNLLLKDIKTLPRRMLAADSNMNVDCVDPLGRLWHLITRTLQMAPHHIWWLGSKNCQPNAK